MHSRTVQFVNMYLLLYFDTEFMQFWTESKASRIAVSLNSLQELINSRRNRRQPTNECNENFRDACMPLQNWPSYR